MSARKDYPYPEDEFDVAASAGGPEGVHRAQRSTARKVMPWIVVLLIVPLISFGMVFWLSQNDTDVSDALFGDDEPSPTAPADDESPDDGADEAGGDEDGADEDGAAEDGADEDGAAEDGGAEDGADEDGADQDGEEEEALPVNREVTVDVLNATQISGLAAIASERLEADGFSAVTAGNFQGGGTRANSAVKYTDPDLESTAEQIASVLGISDIVEDPAPGDGIIVELWRGLE